LNFLETGEKWKEGRKIRELMAVDAGRRCGRELIYRGGARNGSTTKGELQNIDRRWGGIQGKG